MGPKYTIIKPPPSLPYKVDGSSDPKMVAMQDAFNRSGIQVISIGQDYLVSIPSAALFANQSPQLTWNSYALLNQVVCYLKLFRKISVSVEGYSGKCNNPHREKVLTAARARAVANYLWSQGIDSRFVFTHGHGSDKPIVNLMSPGDSSPNSRIEITFRDAVA
ncbi:type IVB secretion system protein IcmN/DotK [Legionella adelaidensis]|nr:type IVB secretion system protein IcmN/DotK [Legionella adelaidensis]